MRFMALVFVAMAILMAPAAAQDSARALARGQSQQAAASVTDDLREAFNASGRQLTLSDADALRQALAEAFSGVPASSRAASWTPVLYIAWQDDASPPNDRRGACGGYVDVGDARVTATSSSRASMRGLARLTCTVMTQSEHAFGWTGFAAISAGEGALVVRFSLTSEDAQLRQSIAPHLSRALEAVLRAVTPAQSETPRPRLTPRAPTPRPQPVPDIDDTI